MPEALHRKVRHLLPSSKAMISFVGAGGKTTCIQQLAALLIDEGATVLISTTTKIFHPSQPGMPNVNLLLGPVTRWELQHPNRNGLPDIAARLVDTESNKLLGYQPEQIVGIFLKNRYDFLLVEADGAKQKPIKAPAEHEPVIPENSSLVVGIVGLSCLGKNLDETVVHRAERLAALAGQPLGSTISRKTIQQLVLADQGLFKDIPESAAKLLVLNQADSPELVKQGNLIGEFLRQAESFANREQVVVGSLISDR